MRKTSLKILVAVCVFLMALMGQAGADTHYVSPGQSIQAAINDANNGDEIEVAPGIYYESINFNFKAVRLYSRDGPEATTIDANGVDSTVWCNNASPSLDGFTITGGYAGSGGGMGIFGYNGYASPTVTNCIFIGNSADSYGGGIYNYYGYPTVINCTFIGNSAMRGGGMAIEGQVPETQWRTTLINCTFSNNTAEDGGGMFNVGSPWGSYPTVANCIFRDNYSANWGGGICYWDSNSTVTNCTFIGNTAATGGGMLNYSSSPTMTNCAFSSNSATCGGGMYNYYSSNSMVTNCTFSGNKSNDTGGGIINNSSSSLTAINCILWGNIPNEIINYDYPSSSDAVTYSDVQGGWAGTGNINADPCFVNPDANDYHLKPDSPCIDAGDTTAVSSGVFVDADSNPRGVDDPAIPDTGIAVVGLTVDMGAYEFQLCRIAGDINCDGMVDLKDLAILCNNWLVGAGPELP
jgi:hypothetical protein